MAGGHVNRERQAEHMAAPHRFCDVKIFLANTEPSTHGIASFRCAAEFGRYRGIADIEQTTAIKLDL